MAAPDSIDNAGPRTDIPPHGWVARFAPSAWRPYLLLARVDRPIGTWLLLWPCWWSLALAGTPWPDPVLLVLFAVGALLLRGAGCCWNDIVDRDLDGRVERTSTRPIPSGQLTLAQASVFMVALGLLGLAVLLSFNRFAVLVGLASLAPVVIYPFMKRITWWPQAFLGLAFNWGALLGWAAARGELGWPPVVLYLAGIAWTLGYDTIYAHQDREDDALVGVRSSARRLGAKTTPALWAFYGLALVGFGAAGELAELGPAFYLGLGLGGLLLAWQVLRLERDNPADCLEKFKANSSFGWILFFAILAGRISA